MLHHEFVSVVAGHHHPTRILVRSGIRSAPGGTSPRLHQASDGSSILQSDSLPQFSHPRDRGPAKPQSGLR